MYGCCIFQDHDDDENQHIVLVFLVVVFNIYYMHYSQEVLVLGLLECEIFKGVKSALTCMCVCVFVCVFVCPLFYPGKNC